MTPGRRPRHDNQPRPRPPRLLAVCALVALCWTAIAQQTAPDALREYRNGNYERAVAICKDEIAAAPRSLDSHVVICWSLIHLGRYAEAQRYALAARGISRADSRVTEILGEISYYEGRNDDALRYFQDYAAAAPDGQRIGEVYWFLGEIYIRLGRFHLADIALSTAVRWDPDNAAWWTRLAYAQERAGALPQAVIAYQKALGLDPQATDARRGLERARQAMR